MTTFLTIIIILLLIFWYRDQSLLKKHITDLTDKFKHSEVDKSTLQVKITELEINITELNKYQGIVDTEKKAQEILSAAQVKSIELSNEANKQLDEANKQAKIIREAADTYSKSLKQTLDNQISNATLEAKNIINIANKRAEEIAGDAYKAMQNANEYEKTVKAMKNIIEGYGDQYLVPTYSLLDDLAEEFGHMEAGEKLKLAREKTRVLLKKGMAAKCDYVENNRKETAIKFVLDAFNGKVDSILSKVKKDNYGTLKQKIQDSYQLVNNNGKAFRNAIINPEYLTSRLDELQWAVIAQELKWEEQEEQRRIREQMREEEKARREYEKAIREAQKEEETLKKLIEKARREVGGATQDQKEKLEQRLAELEEKLKFAEEKNQRALSMAQQTKSGNVYIISNIGSFGENIYKIGMTRRLEPLERVKELGDASVPFSFDVHAMIFSEDAPALERELHKKFLKLQLNKVNPRKEFFKIGLKEIREEVGKMELTPKWTMVAEANEYRESLAIERSISGDSEKQEQWLKHQLEATTIEEDMEEIEM